MARQQVHRQQVQQVMQGSSKGSNLVMCLSVEHSRAENQRREKKRETEQREGSTA
jgi:hypothetical protein